MRVVFVGQAIVFARVGREVVVVRWVEVDWPVELRPDEAYEDMFV